MLKNKALITPVGLVGVTILSGAFLMSSNSSATDNTDVVDQINITVPASCTLSGTNLLHTDTIQNNQYKTDIGSATIKAVCNDTDGLAIYAIGYTDEIDGNNKMHSSTLGSNYDIATGKYVSGTTTNSVWSMKLTPVSGAYAPTIRNDATYNYTNYEIVPSDYTKVAYRVTATDTGTGAIGANFTTNYAVYASSTQPAGTYTGKVKFILVHPQDEVPAQPIDCEGGKVCYNSNSATALGEMDEQTVTGIPGPGGTIYPAVLWASNFSRTGYGFAGWNTAYDYSGATYGPNQRIVASADIQTNGFPLYAVWIPSAGTLQNWNGCSGLAQGSVTALTDRRDNNTYAVAKLADGKCWMIENLRLNNTASNNTDGSLAQGYNPSFIGLATPETANFSNSIASNSLYSTAGSTDAIISGNYQGYRFPRYNNSNTYSRQSSSSYTKSGNTYSMGNYYTWHAAIADTTHYSTTNQSIGNTSLCPTGWRLPRGGDNQNTANNEYLALAIALTGAQPESYSGETSYYGSGNEGPEAAYAFLSYPNNFVVSGYVDDSSILDRGSFGYYWSSTTSDDWDAFYMYFSYGFVYPGTENFDKYSGGAVRCISDI